MLYPHRLESDECPREGTSPYREGLTTPMSEVESIINSTPLTKESDDLRDP